MKKIMLSTALLVSNLTYADGLSIGIGIWSETGSKYASKSTYINSTEGHIENGILLWSLQLNYEVSKWGGFVQTQRKSESSVMTGVNHGDVQSYTLGFYRYLSDYPIYIGGGYRYNQVFDGKNESEVYDPFSSTIAFVGYNYLISQQSELQVYAQFEDIIESPLLGVKYVYGF